MSRMTICRMGVIGLAAIGCASAICQSVVSINDSAFIGSAGNATGGSTCTKLSEQLTDNDFWGGQIISQLFQSSSAKTICTVKFKIQNTDAVNAATVVCRISSAANGGGTQYGADSSAVTVPASSTAWYTFTWSSNPVTSTSDFYVAYVETTGTPVSELRMRVNFGVADHTYCTWNGFNERRTTDACYELWTIP